VVNPTTLQSQPVSNWVQLYTTQYAEHSSTPTISCCCCWLWVRPTARPPKYINASSAQPMSTQRRAYIGIRLRCAHVCDEQSLSSLFGRRSFWRHVNWVTDD